MEAVNVCTDHKTHICGILVFIQGPQKGAIKNNEVQQARNKKRVSAVNSMECLTQNSVLIFLSSQNVNIKYTTYDKHTELEDRDEANMSSLWTKVFFFFFLALLCFALIAVLNMQV